MSGSPQPALPYTPHKRETRRITPPLEKHPPLRRSAQGEAPALGRRKLANSCVSTASTNHPCGSTLSPVPTLAPRDSISRLFHTWRERFLRGGVRRGPHPPHGDRDLSGLVHRARARGSSSHGRGYYRRRDCVGERRPLPLGRFRDVVDVHHSPAGFLRLPAWVPSRDSSVNGGRGEGGRGGERRCVPVEVVHARCWWPEVRKYRKCKKVRTPLWPAFRVRLHTPQRRGCRHRTTSFRVAVAEKISNVTLFGTDALLLVDEARFN